MSPSPVADTGRFIATGRQRPDSPDASPKAVTARNPGRGEESNLSRKLYVGNLPFTSTEEEIRRVFEHHGSVESVNVITDRETGRPRGFAFVEMSEPSFAADAIRALDGSDLGGRSIRVNEAHERQSGAGRGSFGDRYHR